MPYLRLSSLPLDDETKRHLADELTATVLDILPDQKPERTSVHFTPFEPSDFAIAGRLVADGALPDTHLELSATGVDERAWHALRNRLTDVLVEALGIEPVRALARQRQAQRVRPAQLRRRGQCQRRARRSRRMLDLDDEDERSGGGWRGPLPLLGFAHRRGRWIPLARRPRRHRRAGRRGRAGCGSAHTGSMRRPAYAPAKPQPRKPASTEVNASAA